jgi:hypothetical protein
LTPGTLSTGEWTLVCEIDTGNGEPVTVVIP